MSKLRRNANASLDRLKAEYDTAIMEAMAMTLWTDAYESWAEERLPQCTYCGVDLHRDGRDQYDDGDPIWLDEHDNNECEEGDEGVHVKDEGPEAITADDLPSAADKAAAALAKLFVDGNGMSMADLYEWAMTVHEGAFEFDEGELSVDSVDSPRTFGHYLTMQALEHGVAWEDSHKVKRGGSEFTPVMPRFECHFDGEQLSWSGRVGSGEIASGHRGYLGPGKHFIVLEDGHGSYFATDVDSDDATRAELRTEAIELAERYGGADDGDTFRWKVVTSTDVGRARMMQGGPWLGTFRARRTDPDDPDEETQFEDVDEDQEDTDG